MFKTRPCGCKGLRSCLVCEREYGAWRLSSPTLTAEDKEKAYVLCAHCGDLAWQGWISNEVMNQHPNHNGDYIKFPGVKICLEFINSSEEAKLLEHIDEVPWTPSQSGRLKQNYGPKCNFKRKKVKVDTFDGYPIFTKCIQDKFAEVDVLKNFLTVEQCSLEYTPERGASIDPHIDDCWIWGERIPTLSLLTDSTLTMIRFYGPRNKYNLDDKLTYPSVVHANGIAKTFEEIKGDFDLIDNDNADLESKNSENGDVNDIFPLIVRVPMPRRSLLILYGEPRYEWEHGIYRDDITERRVCITYRELTPTYLECGPKADIGRDIIEAGSNFWDHLEKYKDHTSIA